MEGAAAPLRVIFLDIDGVICCNSMGRLEDKKLRILQGVAQTAQAKIVLSTDWRRVPQLKTQLIGALRGLGMDVLSSDLKLSERLDLGTLPRGRRACAPASRPS